MENSVLLAIYLVGVVIFLVLGYGIFYDEKINGIEDPVTLWGISFVWPASLFFLAFAASFFAFFFSLHFIFYHVTKFLLHGPKSEDKTG